MVRMREQARTLTYSRTTGGSLDVVTIRYDTQPRYNGASPQCSRCLAQPLGARRFTCQCGPRSRRVGIDGVLGVPRSHRTSAVAEIEAQAHRDQVAVSALRCCCTGQDPTRGHHAPLPGIGTQISGGGRQRGCEYLGTIFGENSPMANHLQDSRLATPHRLKRFVHSGR
jgi:hypothetical protein